VRHDARAGLELLQQARHQLQVHLRQQVHRHHVDAAQVGLEQVPHLETRQRLYPDALRVLARELHQPRFDVHAEAPGAEALRRLDHDASVARTQVDQALARPGLREVQHALHHRVGRNHERRGAVVPGPALRLHRHRKRGSQTADHIPKQQGQLPRVKLRRAR